MSDPKCKTCKNYTPYPIVKMEGECGDKTKIVYVSDKPSNEPPSVFEFSTCQNHESESASEIKSGDKVTYERCFGDSILTFVAMANDLEYNDCILIFNGKATPATFSGVKKVDQSE